MSKHLTVGELKKALNGVPDEVKVKLSSDTGVDQGEGEIVVECASYICYTANGHNVAYFAIYANDTGFYESEE